MKNALTLLFIMCISGHLFAGGSTESENAVKEYDVFLGYPIEDYPADGTIFGTWLEERTGVRINWEIIAGDIDQKIGLIAASGDYPDAISPRQSLLEAGALIPLNSLIDEYGPNINAIYGDRMEMIKRPDGTIYWFPQVLPYGQEYRKNSPSHGLYVQKAVLESWDYQIPESLEQAANWLIEYARENPEINANPTRAFTGLFWNWRAFPIMNAPTILSGHPNDGAVDVDWVDGKWVVSLHYYNENAYRVYRIYNAIHLAGLYDTEAFVMDYDQYLAKLSTGSILAFYDQDWQFAEVQDLLLNQDEDRWYISIPVVMQGYEPAILNPPQPQVSNGMAITVDAADPEGLMEYFNVLADWETMKMRHWGREGTDYMIADDGTFYRTEEQIAQWRDRDWRDRVYGAEYWNDFLNLDPGSFYPDGINTISPLRQPSVWRASLRQAEIETLEALNVTTFAELFPPPDIRRSAYFPAWTIALPTGSQEGITLTRIEDIRRKYIPLLIMAEAGTYDQVWEEFLLEIEKIPLTDRDALRDYYQNEVDRRVEAAGGY